MNKHAANTTRPPAVPPLLRCLLLPPAAHGQPAAQLSHQHPQGATASTEFTTLLCLLCHLQLHLTIPIQEQPHDLHIPPPHLRCHLCCAASCCLLQLMVHQLLSYSNQYNEV
jgi:hypothetical protein